MAHSRSLTRGNRNVDTALLRQDLTKLNPVIANTLRNAVPRNGQSPEGDEMTGKRTVNPFKLERLSNIISNNINAAVDLRTITPYVDKADLIWRTILLYPNGKQDKILRYDTQPSSKKSSKLHDELLPIWDNYFTNDYKIEKDLKKIISDILINTGSYTLFNLSRPGLDYLINGSELVDVAGNESFQHDARRYFNEEFDTVGDQVLVRNKGKFIRNPDTTVKEVSGIEAIFGNHSSLAGNEFKLFGNLDPDNAFGITFTDNPAALYLQKMNEVKRKRDVASVTGAENLNLMIQSAFAATGNPDQDDGKNYLSPVKDRLAKGGKGPQDPKATTINPTEAQIESLSRQFFPNRNVDSTSIQFVKPSEALKVAPYGRGITWHVPSEAVIPIRRNGSNGVEDDFIFLLDPQDGSFLKNTNDFEFNQSLSKNQSNIANKPKAGSTNSIIANLKNIQEGKDCDFDMSEFADIAKSTIIRRFLQAIVSGRGENISIQLDDETNKIFLQRMFRRQGIRCLYVPGEAVTYLALNYNRLGIGQSLTQMAKMHIARLAAMDLADAMANLEAATPHTLMTINVNEKSPEPFADIAAARAVYFEANPRIHSILSTAQLSVPQIVDALRESSLTVKVNAGENPHIPVHDIELNQMDKSNFKPVDSNSRNDLLNKIANYLHLSKSWLDVSEDQNNFQIEALAEHQMLLNQVVNWQEELGDGLADFMRKHTYVNASLMKALIAKIKENKNLWMPDSKEKIEGPDELVVKIILTDFLNNITCMFPTPTSIETTNKIKDSLDVVKDLVDKWVEMAGHTGNLEQVAKLLGYDTDDSKSLDNVKSQIRSVFLADAFRRYNLPMPFDDIINEGKGGGLASLTNAVVHQRHNVAEFLATLFIGVNETDAKILKAHAKKIDKAVANLAKVQEELGGVEGDQGALGNGTDDENGLSQDDANTDNTDLDLGDNGEGGNGDDLEEPDTTDDTTETDPGVDDDDNPDETEDDPSANKDDKDDDDNADGTDPTKNDPNYQPFKS